jgi:hypothetical protein
LPYRRLDAAYGCFAWVALAVCSVPIIQYLPLSFATWQAFAMLIGLPIALSGIGAGIVGIVLSVVNWREWPLALMSLTNVAMLLLFLGNDEWKTISDRGEAVGCGFGTAILVLFCARWFFVVRKRMKRKAMQA